MFRRARTLWIPLALTVAIFTLGPSAPEADGAADGRRADSCVEPLVAAAAPAHHDQYCEQR